MMGPQDGLDHALRALAALHEERQDWYAIFVGDGDVLPHLRELSKELGISDVVEFTGMLEQEDVVRILSSADVCVAPEPSGPLNDVSTMIKLGEYMAMGKPVACFDLPETRFTAGAAALYAPPNDDEQLGLLIGELLSDADLRARLGAAGRQRVETVLAWKHGEVQLLAAYEHAFTGGGEG
jgi:glycosyltransferase involved in cell wall biosynthesis